MTNSATLTETFLSVVQQFIEPISNAMREAIYPVTDAVLETRK